MRYRYETTQWIACSLPRVFGFFADPANLPRLMPAWQDARIVEASVVAPDGATRQSGPVVAGAGTRLRLSFRPFPLSPVRVGWDAEITEFVSDDHFCDVQLRGPFAYWKHCHFVAAEERGGVAGTLITDRLEYELPFGPLGRVAHWLVVQRQIRAAFAFRQRRLEELMPGSQGSTPLPPTLVP